MFSSPSKKHSAQARTYTQADFAREVSFSPSQIEILRKTYVRYAFQNDLMDRSRFRISLGIIAMDNAGFLADRLFDLLDVDRDGVVHLMDFLKYLDVTMNRDPFEKAKLSFRFIDSTNKGCITYEDIRTLIGQVALFWKDLTGQTVVPSKEHIDEIFGALDTRNTGQVVLADFYKAYYASDCYFQWFELFNQDPAYNETKRIQQNERAELVRQRDLLLRLEIENTIKSMEQELAHLIVRLARITAIFKDHQLHREQKKAIKAANQLHARSRNQFTTTTTHVNQKSFNNTNTQSIFNQQTNRTLSANRFQTTPSSYAKQQEQPLPLPQKNGQQQQQQQQHPSIDFSTMSTQPKPRIPSQSSSSASSSIISNPNSNGNAILLQYPNQQFQPNQQQQQQPRRSLLEGKILSHNTSQHTNPFLVSPNTQNPSKNNNNTHQTSNEVTSRNTTATAASNRNSQFEQSSSIHNNSMNSKPAVINPRMQQLQSFQMLQQQQQASQLVGQKDSYRWENATTVAVTPAGATNQEKYDSNNNNHTRQNMNLTDNPSKNAVISNKKPPQATSASKSREQSRSIFSLSIFEQCSTAAAAPNPHAPRLNLSSIDFRESSTNNPSNSHNFSGVNNNVQSHNEESAAAMMLNYKSATSSQQSTPRRRFRIFENVPINPALVSQPYSQTQSQEVVANAKSYRGKSQVIPQQQQQPINSNSHNVNVQLTQQDESRNSSLIFGSLTDINIINSSSNPISNSSSPQIFAQKSLSQNTQNNNRNNNLQTQQQSSAFSSQSSPEMFLNANDTSNVSGPYLLNHPTDRNRGDNDPETEDEDDCNNDRQYLQAKFKMMRNEAANNNNKNNNTNGSLSSSNKHFNSFENNNKHQHSKDNMNNNNNLNSSFSSQSSTVTTTLQKLKQRQKQRQDTADFKEHSINSDDDYQDDDAYDNTNNNKPQKQPEQYQHKSKDSNRVNRGDNDCDENDEENNDALNEITEEFKEVEARIQFYVQQIEDFSNQLAELDDAVNPQNLPAALDPSNTARSSVKPFNLKLYSTNENERTAAAIALESSSPPSKRGSVLLRGTDPRGLIGTQQYESNGRNSVTYSISNNNNNNTSGGVVTEQRQRRNTMKNMPVMLDKEQASGSSKSNLRSLSLYIGHENWNVVLQIMLVIRSAIKSLKKLNHPALQHQQTTSIHSNEIIFGDRSGGTTGAGTGGNSPVQSSGYMQFANNQTMIPEIRAKDFEARNQSLLFPSTSQNNVELSKYEYIDYCPLVFESLRMMSGITQEAILRALGPENLIGNLIMGRMSHISDLCLSSISSAGTGGDGSASQQSSASSSSTDSSDGLKFQYYSECGRFIVKTIPEKRVVQLLKMLPSYHAHIAAHPDSLLLRIYGLYKLQIREYASSSSMNGAKKPKRNSDSSISSEQSQQLLKNGNTNISGTASQGKDAQSVVGGSDSVKRAPDVLAKHPLYFIVCNNVFDTDLEVRHKFHLKGSTRGRKAVKKNQPFPNASIPKKDLDWIDAKFKIRIPYSLKQQVLAQIHRDCTFLASHQIINYCLLIGVHDVQSQQQNQNQSLNNTVSAKSTTTTTTNSNRFGKLISEDKKQVFFVGAINLFTEFTTSKKWVAMLKNPFLGKTQTTVDPVTYANRLHSFVAINVLE